MAKAKVKLTALISISILLSLFLLVNKGFSQLSFSQNHPELKWQKIETPHFAIIFHQGVDSVAVQVSQIAEQIYPQITDDIGVKPPGRTPIMVTDYLDDSNGLTTPLGHYIFLWTRAMEKYTTGDEDWLKSLVAHEFTHMVSFYAVRGFGGFWSELIALGFIPTWYLEGTAQFEAEKWCAHRDMLLRVVSYHQDVLPYKKLSGFIAADQIDSRLVYEEGHSLVRYIAHRFGNEKIKEIFHKFRAFPVSFNLALKRAIGLSEKELFLQWKKDIDAHYKSQYENQIPVTEIGDTVDLPFQAIYGARWSPDGKYLAVVAVKDFDSHVRELFLQDRKTGKIECIAAPFVNSIFSWSPDSRSIVFSQQHVVPSGSEFFDLFLFNLGTKKIHQLTVGERANDPDFSPSGKEIVYSKHETTGSNLWILNLQTGAKKQITKFKSWNEVFSPRWSPDGRKIAFSLFDNHQNRDIFSINADGTNLSALVSTSADDRYPAWSCNGEKLAFLSYVNGTPNLYIKNLKTGKADQITQSPGGVFLPEWLPEKEKISVISFENRERIPLVIVDAQQTITKTTPVLEPVPFHTDVVPIYQRDDFLSNFPAPQLKTASYSSFRAIRPQILLPYADWSEKGWQPGAIIRFADPLEKHALLTAFSYRARPHFSLNYINQQFAPTIQAYLQRTTIDHGEFLYLEDGSSVPLIEDFRTGSVGLYWQINRGKSLLAWHNLSLRATFTHRKVINQDDFSDPDISDTYMPFQGWTNIITFGYSFIKYRPDVFYDIHPKTGESFSIAYSRASSLLGSDLVFNQISLLGVIRQQLPFLKHVIALRSGIFLREGEQAIQSRPALGMPYLRGVTFSRSGTRQVFANAEYRFPIIRDLGLKVWIFYFEQFCGAFFTDVGKAWISADIKGYRGNARPYSNADWIQTFGFELRHRFYILGKIPSVLHVGYGVNVNDFEERKFFVSFGRVF